MSRTRDKKSKWYKFTGRETMISWIFRPFFDPEYWSNRPGNKGGSGWDGGRITKRLTHRRERQESKRIIQHELEELESTPNPKETT